MLICFAKTRTPAEQVLQSSSCETRDQRGQRSATTLRVFDRELRRKYGLGL
jgi:hypothetical protein